MAADTQTALVLKPVARCEWGTDAEGFIAQPFDRVTVKKVWSWSCGGKGYDCVTDSGEKFRAGPEMVQLD